MGGSPRSLQWGGVAALMLSDIVGTSVLTFSGVTSDLGWLLTAVLILSLCPICLYISLIMSRTRTMLLASRKGAVVGTMGEVASSAFRSERAGQWVELAVYSTTFLGQASYLLVLGTSLQQALLQVQPCLYSATALGCASLIPVVFLVRSLNDSVPLCAANTLLIVAVIGLAIRGVLEASPAVPPVVHMVTPDLRLPKLMGAAANVLYSYAGQWMYFEIMDAMQEPTSFPTVYALVGPFMAFLYLVVALCGYFYGARGADLLSSVHPGPLLQALGCMMYVHVAIVYLLKSIVLTRYISGRMGSHSAALRAAEGTSWSHGAISCAMLAVGYGVANCVPFFSQLLGLIGAVCAGPVNFLVPVALYVAARRGGQPVVDEEAIRAGDGSQQIGKASRDAVTNRGAARKLGPLFVSTFAQKLPAWEVVLMSFIVSFTILTMMCGLADEVSDIFRLQQTYGMPFSCHALVTDALWDAGPAAAPPSLVQLGTAADSARRSQAVLQHLAGGGPRGTLAP